jgi:hypothetical protein
MKHVTTADKSLLIGDEAAEMLVSYAALLGQHNSADDVTLSAYGSDGDPVEVTFLLNSGTTLVIESSESEVPEPDNQTPWKIFEGGCTCSSRHRRCSRWTRHPPTSPNGTTKGYSYSVKISIQR